MELRRKKSKVALIRPEWMCGHNHLVQPNVIMREVFHEQDYTLVHYLAEYPAPLLIRVLFILVPLVSLFVSDFDLHRNGTGRLPVLASLQRLKVCVKLLRARFALCGGRENDEVICHEVRSI